jgi:hypothetical protein
VNIVRLASADRRLLVTRYVDHGNSHRRMRTALEEVAAEQATMRLNALRSIERRFGIDLASFCHRYDKRDDPDTHPIERMIMNYIAEPCVADTGALELWVLLDRLAQIRDLSEDHLVSERGS